MFLSGCEYSVDNKHMDYCYSINELIKNIDFFKGNIAEDKILLYDTENNLVSEIPFEQYNNNISIIYIKKDMNNTYFVLQGSVDDEYGIMFINDDANNVLSGINSMDRVGGNAYLYSTQ